MRKARVGVFVTTNRFYVYIHVRKDNRAPFYVGKGCGHRAWTRRGRNEHWRRVYQKAGYEVHICQDNMNEGDAFLLEEWLIAKITHQGIKLTNQSIGGPSGASGPKPYLMKAVNCCTGQRFESIGAAADWLNAETGRRGAYNVISACCNEAITQAYGFTFWFDGRNRQEIKGSGYATKARAVKVYCSNGMDFVSIAEAAKWASKGINWKNAAAKIGECARGKRLVCHGHSWSFDSVPDKPDTLTKRSRDRRGVKVRCGNGMLFGSMAEAVEWVRDNVKPTAGRGRIIMACKGKTDMAYGLEWNYESSTEGVGR